MMTAITHVSILPQQNLTWHRCVTRTKYMNVTTNFDSFADCVTYICFEQDNV